LFFSPFSPESQKSEKSLSAESTKRWVISKQWNNSRNNAGWKQVDFASRARCVNFR
jgi:hypothetical protein